MKIGSSFWTNSPVNNSLGISFLSFTNSSSIYKVAIPGAFRNFAGFLRQASISKLLSGYWHHIKINIQFFWLIQHKLLQHWYSRSILSVVIWISVFKFDIRKSTQSCFFISFEYQQDVISEFFIFYTFIQMLIILSERPLSQHPIILLDVALLISFQKDINGFLIIIIHDCLTSQGS